MQQPESAVIWNVGALGTGLFFLRKQHQNHEPGSTSGIVISTEPDNSEAPTEGDGFVMPDTPAADLLHQAYLLASGYDYDAAIELLKGSEEFAADPEVISAIAGYESTKATLIRTPHQQNHPRVLPHADRGSIQSLRRRPGSEWLQSGHDHHRRIQ